MSVPLTQPPVDLNYYHLDTDTLQRLYLHETERLKVALLEGSSWQEVQELRHRITDIEAALYRHVAPGSIHTAAGQPDREGTALPE
ncbi:hypothetical protein [Flaviaesturariibacter terrae]